MRGRILIAGLVLLLMAGCSIRPSLQAQTETSETAEAAIAMGLAAERIHNALLELRASLDTPPTPLPKSTAAKDGPLAQPITLHWAGPTLPALRTVASMIGYSLESKGYSDKAQSVIYINVDNEPALSVLEDIGWQAGSDMGVVVSESERTVYVFAGAQK